MFSSICLGHFPHVHMPNKHFLRAEVNSSDQSVRLACVQYVVAFNIIDLLKSLMQIVEIRKLGFRNNAVPTCE